MRTYVRMSSRSSGSRDAFVECHDPVNVSLQREALGVQSRRAGSFVVPREPDTVESRSEGLRLRFNQFAGLTEDVAILRRIRRDHGEAGGQGFDLNEAL